MDWIQGQKFMDIAHFVYAPKERDSNDYYNIQNTLHPKDLKPLNVVYTHIMYAKKLMDVIRLLEEEFIVVTHSCDCSVIEGGISRPNGVGKVQYQDKFEVPKNVVRWYSKNVDVVDPRIKSIPIGLENDRWFVKEKKKEKMLEKLSQQRGDKNLLYMNHQICTNPYDRAWPYDLFEGKSWVTAKRGMNGKGFTEYLDDLYSHKFIICPQGNGIDTHRTWEALYMGTIPIERRNINNQFYKDLPICFVDQWDEITESFLEKEYVRIKTSHWNMRKLEFNYWKEKINEVFVSHSSIQR